MILLYIIIGIFVVIKDLILVILIGVFSAIRLAGEYILGEL